MLVVRNSSAFGRWGSSPRPPKNITRCDEKTQKTSPAAAEEAGADASESDWKAEAITVTRADGEQGITNVHISWEGRACSKKINDDLRNQKIKRAPPRCFYWRLVSPASHLLTFWSLSIIALNLSFFLSGQVLLAWSMGREIIHPGSFLFRL